MEQGVEKLKIKMYQYKVAQEHLFSLLPQPTPSSLNSSNKTNLLTKNKALPTIKEHHDEEEKSDLEHQPTN